MVVLTAGCRGQFSYDSLQSDAGDVSELFLVCQHVGTECVHYSLDLVLLHLTDQQTQAGTQHNLTGSLVPTEASPELIECHDKTTLLPHCEPCEVGPLFKKGCCLIRTD